MWMPDCHVRVSRGQTHDDTGVTGETYPRNELRRQQENSKPTDRTSVYTINKLPSLWTQKCENWQNLTVMTQKKLTWVSCIPNIRDAQNQSICFFLDGTRRATVRSGIYISSRTSGFRMLFVFGGKQDVISPYWPSLDSEIMNGGTSLWLIWLGASTAQLGFRTSPSLWYLPAVWVNLPNLSTGVGKCPILGILDITL